MMLWSLEFHIFVTQLNVDKFFIVLSESGVLHSKPVYKKENGANDQAGSSSASGQSGNQTYYQFPSHRLKVISLLCTCQW